MQNISEIEELIKLISKLPGLGPKSAKRIVLKLINNRDELVKPMANTLAQVYKNVVRCNSCGALKSNSIEFLCCHPSGVSLNERNIFSELQPKNNSNKNNLYESFFINIFSNY